MTDSIRPQHQLRLLLQSKSNNTMANKTIYPYGTEGTLPSSVGIINDLKTGGADKALSAEQGTVIRPYIMDVYDDVDLSEITESNYSLTSTLRYWWPSGMHKVIPVNPGDPIRVTAHGPEGSDGGFYAFFTSAYFPPTDPNSDPPYASSGGRVWVSGSREIVAPADAAYLCICTADGQGIRKTWSVSKFVAASLLLPRSEVSDSILKGQIPEGLTKHEYSGPLVKFEKKHMVAAQQVATITSVSCQGGACFGDYLFLFTENNTTCWIYNLAQNALLQTINIPAAERGFVSNCHCNSVSFGKEYYDANDPFPLIYVSTGYASDGYTGALVYRIVATTENDVTTYSLSLVQTLKMPGTGWTEFLTGEDGFCLLCYTNTRTIYKMQMPVLADGDVTFDLEQALSVYQFTPQPSWYNGSYNQGRFYRDGKIYLVSGNTQQTRLFIVLNLAEEKREVEIDLNATFGLSGEPEACFIWEGHLCIAYRSDNKVYALYFE